MSTHTLPFFSVCLISLSLPDLTVTFDLRRNAKNAIVAAAASAAELEGAAKGRANNLAAVRAELAALADGGDALACAPAVAAEIGAAGQGLRATAAAQQAAVAALGAAKGPPAPPSTMACPNCAVRPGGDSATVLALHVFEDPTGELPWDEVDLVVAAEDLTLVEPVGAGAAFIREVVIPAAGEPAGPEELRRWPWSRVHRMVAREGEDGDMDLVELTVENDELGSAQRFVFQCSDGAAALRVLEGARKEHLFSGQPAVVQAPARRRRRHSETTRLRSVVFQLSPDAGAATLAPRRRRCRRRASSSIVSDSCGSNTLEGRRRASSSNSFARKGLLQQHTRAWRECGDGEGSDTGSGAHAAGGTAAAGVAASAAAMGGAGHSNGGGGAGSAGSRSSQLFLV